MEKVQYGALQIAGCRVAGEHGVTDGAVSGLPMGPISIGTAGAALQGFKGQKAGISGHIEFRRFPGEGVALVYQTVSAGGDHNAVEGQCAGFGAQRLLWAWA